jgi:hypothetical protein
MNIPKTFLFTTALSLGALVAPLAAQTNAAPTAGPVHYPTGYTTNAPVSTAADDSSSTPVTASPMQSAPPVLSAPVPSTMLSPSTASAAPAGDVDTASDIRDIRGVMSIPYQWLWAAYGVLGFVVAALLFMLWRWFSRRPKTRTKEPYEIALERLEAARGLMTENQVREYAFTVSEIIRSYIEQRFGERAAHRTTEEFLSDLMQRPNPQLAEHRGLLQDFLNHCDLPKFARWQLSVREMESMHESARAFISDTRPQLKPAAGATQPELASAP